MMGHQQIEKREPGVYGVIGDLTFDTVVLVEQEGIAALDQTKESVVFDLSTVGACSSATLGLLLSWLRYAQAQGKQLTVKGMPEQLQALIKNAQLQAVIPLAT